MGSGRQRTEHDRGPQVHHRICHGHVKVINKDRLIKLLNLTNSDSDFEALSALRAANKMVGGNWGWLRDGEQQPKEPSPVKTPDPQMISMILFCRNSGLVTPTTMILLDRLEKKIRSGSSLGPKDRERLASIYHGCGGGR